MGEKKHLQKKTKIARFWVPLFQVIFHPPPTSSRPGNGGLDAAIDALPIATGLGVIGQGVKKKVDIFEHRRFYESRTTSRDIVFRNMTLDTDLNIGDSANRDHTRILPTKCSNNQHKTEIE